MKIVRNGFIFSTGILCLLFLPVRTIHGQVLSPRSYLFVEVKDVTGQVVTDATVTVSDVGGKEITSKTTDQDGLARAEFLPRSDHHYNVQVSKSGYLSSEHVFFSTPGSENLAEGISNDSRRAVIVLRKTPVTSAARQAIDADERKYQLLLAAKRGDAASVGKLLRAGVVNTVDSNGVPAIVWAAYAGDAETIKALLVARADVRNKNTLAHQALLIYLAEGLPRERKIRAPANRSSPESRKTLRECHDEIVLKLIKAGAGVNEKTFNWGTVLNDAINQVPDFLSSQTIEALIAAGANINAADESRGRTPLMSAAQTRSLETVKMLLNAGASINAKDKSASTALMWAQTALIYPGHYNPKIVKALIAAGADVNAVDEYGRTTLMFAAQADLLDSVEMLLAAGAKASIDAKDKWGDTALIHAFNLIYDSTRKSASHPSSTIIKALIAAGANINDVNVNGRTTLMLAAETNSLETIKILLEAGASINAKDKKGQTVLMYDELWYHFPDLEIIKALISAKPDLNVVDEHGRTSLMLAAQNAPIEIVRVLLQAGAGTSVNVKDKFGRTALFYVCYTSYLATTADKELVAKELIAAGANVNEIDKEGQTALMTAAIFGFNDSWVGIARVLIAAGADVNLKDSHGQTALVIAKQYGHEAMVKFLEEKAKP